MRTGSFENEIKLRWPRLAEEARLLILEKGYSLLEPRTLEADEIYDRGGELRGSSKLLRVRRAGDLCTVTYKGPPVAGPHKNREELEFEASDANACALVLERLGYASQFRYEKFRTKYGVAGEPGIITIDETPIGVFLELEGAAAWIDHTATFLGFDPAAYVTASYAALYRTYRETHKEAPPNMTFPAQGPT